MPLGPCTPSNYCVWVNNLVVHIVPTDALTDDIIVAQIIKCLN
jgi:hypothetical protein